MQTINQAEDNFVASFAMQRQRLLHEAGSVLCETPAPEKSADAIGKLSQMLVTALEVLKVAETEIVDERRRAASERASQQRRLDHLDAMFNLAPTPLILTTADSTIRECNRAAASLFGVDQYRLAGKPIGDMVPRQLQAEFREQLALAVQVGSVAAWSFRINLTRSVDPIDVTAAVEVIDDAAVGTRALYWNIRPA